MQDRRIPRASTRKSTFLCSWYVLQINKPKIVFAAKKDSSNSKQCPSDHARCYQFLRDLMRTKWTKMENLLIMTRNYNSYCQIIRVLKPYSPVWKHRATRMSTVFGKSLILESRYNRNPNTNPREIEAWRGCPEPCGVTDGRSLGYSRLILEGFSMANFLFNYYWNKDTSNSCIYCRSSSV
jgi:hypothetical protein